jgi:hypothetical protein
MDDENKTNKPLGFALNISARGFLRGTALLIAVSLVYLGLGALCQNQDVDTAGMSFLTILALMMLFAAGHGLTPNEVSELNARTSGRGIIRWLGLTACIGTAVNTQFAGWWLHNLPLAETASMFTIISMGAFTMCYIVYTRVFTSEHTASRRCWSIDGTARDALVKMGAISTLNLLLVGLSAGSGMAVLATTISAMLVTVIFAVLHCWLVSLVDIDDDRG